MPTKLSIFAARLIESGWLAALVIVPVFFNPYSERSFEEDKIPLLRTIALVMLAALIVRGLEEGRRTWQVAGRPAWRLPLVQAAGALTAAYGISTIFSIVPHISFWGSYERMQGTYTWVSYMVVFAAIVLLARERGPRQRIVTATLLASFPVSAYAVAQHFGHDSIRWASDVTQRSFGTMGNAIFLAAVLIMAVPLTLVRLCDHVGRRPARSSERFQRRPLIAAYLALLCTQLLAIYCSKSRGPFVGLGVGLACFAIMLALERGYRRLSAALVAAFVLGSLSLAALNLPQLPLHGLREARYLGRMTRLVDPKHGTVKVRTLIWQGATELLAANPMRDVFGYGPETLLMAYSPFYPPDLAHYEFRRVEPDRAHNETFDALIMLGAFGCLAEIAVFVTFFYCVVRWLGMCATVHLRRRFIGLVLSGALVGGGILPYVLDRGFRFAGIGLPLGMVVALLIYLFTAAVAGGRYHKRMHPADNLLLIGVFAAVVAHFVEIQSGIAISATRLLFWAYAGLAISVGVCRSSTEEAEESRATVPLARAGAADRTMLGLLVGLILILVTFGFYRPGPETQPHGMLFPTLLLLTWGLGAIIVTAEHGNEQNARGSITALRNYSVPAIAAWCLFTIVYVAWLSWHLDENFRLDQVIIRSRHLANAASLLYLAVFAVIALLACSPPVPTGTARMNPWHLLAAAALLAVLAPVIVRTNLDVSRADMFDKLVVFYQHHNRWEAAQLVAEEALRLQPDTERYATDLVQVLMGLARGTAADQQQRRMGYLAHAQAVLERAHRHNPFKMENARNLGRLHRFWGQLTSAPNDRLRHITATDRWYAAALQLMPSYAALWNEWATFYIERREPEKAMALLDRSLQIDDRYSTTHWIRGNLLFDQDKLQAALDEYDRALAIYPDLLAALSSKALVLARLNRLPEAIEANRRALRFAPDDLISHRNLAILYRQTGQLDRALAEAQAALAVAEGDDRVGLQQFIQELQVTPPEH